MEDVQIKIFMGDEEMPEGAVRRDRYTMYGIAFAVFDYFVGSTGSLVYWFLLGCFRSVCVCVWFVCFCFFPFVGVVR